MESWRKFLGEKVFSDYSGGKKDKWVKLPSKELQSDPDNVDITDELYSLIKKSYAYIGGHFKIKSPEDIPAGNDNWIAVDVDDDPEPDAVRAGKAKEAGIKMTLGATDQTKRGKEAYLSKEVDLLTTPGNYGELSGALAHIMIKRHNISFVDNEEDVRKVLGKEIEWIGPHPEGKYPDHAGWYRREIAGSQQMKILVGRPFGVKVQEPVKDDAEK